MYCGVAYYPEQWPRERWALDARQMREAGINGVRVGEAAWSRLEPLEGDFDFSWLDEALDALAGQGIGAIVCTPSRTPPPWAFSKYPEIRNVNRDGRVANSGTRYAVCLNNPTFGELSRRIDRAVIEHFAKDARVMGWHIDHEIGAGNTCYCETCRRRFISHLRQKYGSIEDLNARWGAHFWSIAFNDFEDVPLPAGSEMPFPALALEYARFTSQTNAEFAHWRYELMKTSNPLRWVTTNFQRTDQAHTDVFELGLATDVFGANHCLFADDEFALDYHRGPRGELIVNEECGANPGHALELRPGWLRLWAYLAIGHGACGINFRRWRACRWGQEQTHGAILPHSGRAGQRYYELTQVGHELRQVGPLIDSTRPRSDVAIVLGYDTRWAMMATMGTSQAEALSEARRYHAALARLNVSTDGLDPRERLSRYRLVIAPALYCVDSDTAENLRRFVAEGGVLCVTPRSGIVDEYGKAFAEPAPGPLGAVAGVQIDERYALKGPVRIAGQTSSIRERTFVASVWADEMELVGAECVASYAEGVFRGRPAITTHRYGRGYVVVVGTVLQDESLVEFVSWLLAEAGVARRLADCNGLRLLERGSYNLRVLFALNFTEEPRSIGLGDVWRDVFTGERCDSVAVPPADVRILSRRQ